MSDHNKGTALRYLEAMGHNDAETAMDCFLPEGVQRSMGSSGLSTTSTVAQMRDGLMAFKQLLPDGLNFEMQTVIAEADKVVVECRGTGRTADDAVYHNEYCFVFTMQDGKIKSSNEYFCTKLADEVLLPRAIAMGALGTQPS